MVKSSLGNNAFLPPQLVFVVPLILPKDHKPDVFHRSYRDSWSGLKVMHARIAIDSSHTRSRCRASINGRRRDDDRPALFKVHSDGLPSHDLPVYHRGLQIARFLETDGRATCDHPPPFARQALSQISSRMRHQYTTAVFRSCVRTRPVLGRRYGLSAANENEVASGIGGTLPQIGSLHFRTPCDRSVDNNDVTPFPPITLRSAVSAAGTEHLFNFFLSAHMSPERLADENLLRQRARPTS
jgi:hypothetical protein